MQPTDEMTPTCTLRKVFWFFVTFFASYAKQDPFDFYFLLNLRPSCILISDSLEKVNNGFHNVAKIILKSHDPFLISQLAFSQKAELLTSNSSDSKQNKNLRKDQFFSVYIQNFLGYSKLKVSDMNKLFLLFIEFFTRFKN